MYDIFLLFVPFFCGIQTVIVLEEDEFSSIFKILLSFQHERPGQSHIRRRPSMLDYHHPHQQHGTVPTGAEG